MHCVSESGGLCALAALTPDVLKRILSPRIVLDAGDKRETLLF